MSVRAREDQDAFATMYQTLHAITDPRGAASPRAEREQRRARAARARSRDGHPESGYGWRDEQEMRCETCECDAIMSVSRSATHAHAGRRAASIWHCLRLKVRHRTRQASPRPPAAYARPGADAGQPHAVLTAHLPPNQHLVVT